MEETRFCVRKIKSRTTFTAPKKEITLKELKLLLVNTFKANTDYDTVITAYKTTAQNSPILVDDITNELTSPYNKPQNYNLYSPSVYPVYPMTAPDSRGWLNQSSIDIDLSDAQVGDKYRFIISSYDNSGFEVSEPTPSNPFLFHMILHLVQK